MNQEDFNKMMSEYERKKNQELKYKAIKTIATLQAAEYEINHDKSEPNINTQLILIIIISFVLYLIGNVYLMAVYLVLNFVNIMQEFRFTSNKSFKNGWPFLDKLGCAIIGSAIPGIFLFIMAIAGGW